MYKGSTRLPARRIAVIAHGLRVAGGLSVGKNMVEAMARLAPQHDYLFTIPAGLGYEDICSRFPNARTCICHNVELGFSRLQFEFLGLPRLVKEFRPDVVLALGSNGLTRLKCPQAILCHNSYLFYPKKHFGKDTLQRRIFGTLPLRRLCLRRNLRWTQLLICQTQAAAERARQFYKYSGPTMVCPNAVSQFVTTNGHKPVVPEPLAPYSDRMKLFYLARYYTHKNLEILVDVFRKYRCLEDVVAIITIAEDQQPGAARLIRAIRKHGLQDKIINVGPLDQTELEGYFRNCQALVMPTLLESFSGTYLEAMHFGLPILTSDLDFAHAVCGDAALYFDPWSPASVRDAVLKIKDDPQSASRLASRGKKRLQSMYKSWDEIVEEVLQQLGGIVDKYPPKWNSR